MTMICSTSLSWAAEHWAEKEPKETNVAKAPSRNRPNIGSPKVTSWRERGHLRREKGDVNVSSIKVSHGRLPRPDSAHRLFSYRRLPSQYWAVHFSAISHFETYTGVRSHCEP